MTCIAALEAEDARLQAQVEEAEASCDECVEPKSPGFFRCYFCDKRFCGPHGAPHFKRTENIEVERDGYKALAERRGKALEPFSFCQAVQHKPAEYVTREMAIDAGEPTMEGTLLRGEVSGPCDTCDGCHARAALAATPEEAATR